MTQRSLEEINQEYHAAAANLGALTFRSAVIEEQRRGLIQRLAQLEQEASDVSKPVVPDVLPPETPKKGSKAAEKRAKALAKAAAVRAKRGSKH